MIRAVVFDFGNVICRFDLQVIFKRFAHDSGKSTHEVELVLRSHGSVFEQYETGLISSREFYQKIATLCGLRMSEAEFTRAYTDKFSPIEDTIKLIRHLKGKCLLGLLSNTSEWDFQYGIKPLAVFPLFDVQSLSFQVRAMKPSQKIYHDILEQLKVSPHEVLYFDDVLENVEAGRRLGMQGVQFKDPADATAALSAAGLLSGFAPAS